MKIKETFKKIIHLHYMKYLIVLAFGIVFIGFLDENSMWSHFRYKQRLAELKAEIEVYETRFNRDQEQIRQLQHNPKAMERIARERYFMKHVDEDIFVLSDDENNETKEQNVYEGTE